MRIQNININRVNIYSQRGSHHGLEGRLHTHTCSTVVCRPVKDDTMHSFVVFSFCGEQKVHSTGKVGGHSYHTVKDGYSTQEYYSTAENVCAMEGQ